MQLHSLLLGTRDGLRCQVLCARGWRTSVSGFPHFHSSSSPLSRTSEDTYFAAIAMDTISFTLVQMGAPVRPFQEDLAGLSGNREAKLIVENKAAKCIGKILQVTRVGFAI